MYRKFKRQLISAICLLSIIGSVAFTPVAVQAQGLPTIDVANLIQGSGKIVIDKIVKVLGDAALGAVRSGLNAILGKLAYDAAVFVATGDVGQDSLFYKDDEGTFIGDAADLAAGGAIEGFATAAGFDAAGLCNPGGDFAINLTLGLDITAQKPYQPACTLTELAGNWESAYSDPDFGKLVNLQFDPTANALGVSMEAENVKVIAEVDSIQAAIAERTGKDFKPVTSTVSGYIETPGSQVKAQLEQTQVAQTKAFDMIGNPIADAVNIFASTLFSKLMERMMEGLANARSGTELSSIISGEGSGASQGIAAAQESYADLKTPAFGQPGTFDILSELQACPDEEASRSVNNCTIGPVLSLAILEGWTVQELVDYYEANGNQFRFADSTLTPDDVANDAGITYKGILVLKKYRIAPVGWDLAGQYVIHDDTDVTPTLKELNDSYESCGADDFSDYCHLIDPFWVLKAPQNFCQREAPGPDLADITEFDDDANEATQNDVIYNRLNYCADNRGCIQEEEEGVCTAYGYCTEESRIYRFEGESCENDYSSCETFTDADDNEVSYLKSSVNYNDCATDPGCQWYCLSTNEAGDYDCASPTETFISCTEDFVASSSDYTFQENVACSCTAQDTCLVRPGSDLGDDSGSYEFIASGTDADTKADGVYDFWQCRVFPDASNTDSYQVCELDAACGAGNPNYDPETETCTCTMDYSCDVTADATGCTATDTADNDGDTLSIGCTLNDEDGDGTEDSCDSTYSTYTQAPVCEPASTTTMYCGDSCIIADGATSCVNSLGNTCVDGDATDSDSTTGVCVLDDSCNISSGSFSCSTDNGNTCAIGVETEEPSVANDTLYFDANAEDCDSGDAGCNQYIRIKDNTNLLSNSFFTYYDEDQNELDEGSDGALTIDDRDFIGFCTHDGGGCDNDLSCNEDLNGDGTVADSETVGECKGWIQDDLSVYVLTGSYVLGGGLEPVNGEHYIQLGADGDTTQTGTLSTTVDTGQSVSERTFTLAYKAQSPEDDGTDNCSFSFNIGNGADTEIETVTSIDNGDDTTLDAYTSSWQDFEYTYTFPDEADTAYYAGTGDAGSEVSISIQNDDTCNINIDAVQLMETDSFDDEYADYYVNNLLYLNGDTISCEPEDVGCELYTEAGKDEEEGVPGLITNPDSSACVNADGSYNYGNSACNQCDGNVDADEDVDKYVGCGFYKETSIDHTVPITEDLSWLSTEERDGVVERFGGYCEYDQSQYCFDNNDCGDQNGDGTNDSCQLQVSIVPSSGEQCSVAYVGCEEYTNLEATEAGGETLSYYSELKQCVKTNDDDTDVFYTFEGSEDGGIQIEDHTLKVVHDTGTDDGAPCTNLDLESEGYNADCEDYVTATPNDCGPDGDDAYGADSTNYDPDCRQYINDEGDIYYRYESEVVVASDECTTLRNSLDTRVYFAVASESVSCPAQFVGCREYKGTDAGNVEEIINDSLSSNTTTDWEGAGSTSNESPLQNGYSLELHSTEGGAATASTDFTGYEFTEITTALTEEDGDGTAVGKLTAGSSYLLTFWAKVDNSASQALFWMDPLVNGINTPYYFTTSGWTDSRTQAAVDLDPNEEGGWQFYQVGPVILDEDVEVDDASIDFHMQFIGAAADSTGYITTIQLTESTDQYVIKGTADTCLNFEGCREYTDRDSNVNYLKSFERLCGDDVVGCEAMFSTQNSTNPFTEAYNLDNEYDEDDVIVQEDQAVTLVYDEDNECSDSVYGCSEIGLPSVDERTGEIDEFTDTYIRDLPDQYSSILCEQPQLSCREYTSEFDGTVYFKDPGDRLCTLEEYTNDAGEALQGWFKADSDSATPDCPKQFDYADPSQPLGGVCNSNSINAASGDNNIGKLCNSDSDCYPDGWSSSDPTPRCISNTEDDIDLFDGALHQYLIYGDDGETLETDDFGWVGQCPSSESGCSEYVDPYSPNIEEANKNWSFESDVLWENSVRYDTEDEPNGYPDYWHVPMNSGSASYYDSESATTSTFSTQFDIGNDGTADFDEECNSWQTGDTYATSSSATAEYSTQFGESNDRVTLTNSSSYVSYGVTPADGDGAVWLNNCGIENTKYVAYDRDKLYTVRAMVKLNYSETAYTNSEFSVGLRYYDDNYDDVDVDDTYNFIAADHETIDWSTESEQDDSDSLSVWYQFQGNIGLGSTVEFPDPELYGNCENTTYTNQVDCEANTSVWHPISYAAMFVANHDDTYTSPVWFDGASFKENDKYYYLDYTVDGTSEFEQQTGSGTCIDPDTEEGAITSDGGCVAFRDVTYDTQNYSQNAIDCANCLLTPNSDSCRYIADACDTNTVLKVKRDRVCSEWLACSDAEVVTDDDGNESVQCFKLDRCDELDEDGNCLFSNDLVKPERDKITSLTDLHYTSAPGDAESLLEARNLTGYSKAGMTWLNTQVCSGGSTYAGELCNADADCWVDSSTNDGSVCSDVVEVEGYIPYGWMYEVGSDGSETGDDLIEHNTFENLYCVGIDADPAQSCMDNAESAGVTSASTAAGNCFRTEFEERLTNVDDAGDLITSDDPSPFVDGRDDPADAADGYDDANGNSDPTYYCPNSPEFSYWPFAGSENGVSGAEFTHFGWQPLNTSTDVAVSQFSNNTKSAFTRFGGSSSVGFTCLEDSCPQIDVNNVLRFTGNTTDAEEPAGVEYDFYDNIEPNAEYSITFDGRFDGSYTAIGEGDDPTTLSICLNHNNLVLEGSCSGGSCSNGDGTCSIDSDCEIPLDRRDCWVEGVSAADVVFVMDTSSSMTDEIATLRSAVPGLAQELADREIDAQFAVVDMNMEASSTVDFDTLELDLTSDITAITNTFSSSSSTCTGDDHLAGSSSTYRTDTPCLHAYSSSVDGFGAITKVLENDLDAYNANQEDDETISFRSNALPIIMLVTDTGDEKSSNAYTESTVTNLLYQNDAVIISVNPETLYNSYGTAEEVWGGITDASGGGISTAIADSDWTVEDSVIDDVLEIIDREVDQFQISNYMSTYSFGPLETTQLSTEDDNVGVASGQTATTDLEIAVSGSTPVEIDNVSLKPVLEVRKNDEVVGRTCRAYPSADAEQCEYTEPSGAVYKGWKGYCVETDPTDHHRCVTWWPLDYLTGEESVVSRTQAGYDGRSEVYHCLVAKGLEDPGFCNEADWNTSDAIGSRGQGVICTRDSQCGSGECINDMQYDIPSGEANKNSISQEHTEATADRNSDDGYSIRMRWQTHDPYDAAGGASQSGSGDWTGEYSNSATSTDTRYGSSLVTRLPANEQLRNIHVSEIDSIIFNTGSAGDANSNDSEQEYKWWGQLGYDPGSEDSNESVATADPVKEYINSAGDDADLSDCNDLPCQDYGNWVLTDFDAGSVYQSDTGDYQPWENCYPVRQDSSDLQENTMGFGCRVWGLYDSNFLKSYYDTELADGKVDNTASSMDIVYVWAWSNFDWGYNTNDSDSLDYDCNDAKDDEDKALYRWEWLENEYKNEFFDSPCIGNGVKKVMGFSDASDRANDEVPDDSISGNRNPWEHISSTSDLQDCIEDTVTTEDTETCLLTNGIGRGNNPSTNAIWESLSDLAESRADGINSAGGSNIFSLWIDVDDEGYIQAVYYLIYAGAYGTPAFISVGVDYGVELTYGNHMHLDFQVRESCALIATSVDESGENVAWADRSTNGGDYYIEGDAEWSIDANYEPFGSITPIDETFDVADNLVTEGSGIYNWANYNEQPVLFYEGGTGGRPLSCIGKCENQWCTSNFEEGGTYLGGLSSTDSDDCGDYGKLMGVGATTTSGSEEGLNSAHANLTDQIEDAASTAQSRFKHIFADIIGDYYKIDLNWSTAPSTLYDAEDADSVDYWEDGSGNNIFDEMEPCTSDDGQRPVSTTETSEYEAEYCGVLPTVSNITIDGNDAFSDNYYDVSSGKTVTLSFDATVDIEQEWLDQIYIDWGDGSTTPLPWEAQATTHVFTHAYRCGPEYQDYAVEYNNNGSECVYQPKITITDNWRFCSGTVNDDTDDDGSITDADATSGQTNRYDTAQEDVIASCNSYDVPAFNVRVTVGN